jgi:solute carrier family 44 (choline transporter-like protein), member 1
LTQVEFIGEDEAKSTCVKNCSKGFVEIGNRCLSGHKDYDTFLDSIGKDLMNSWPTIVVMCILALVFSYILLVLFRYAIKYVIWVINIGVLLCLIAGTTRMFMLFAAANSPKIEDEKDLAATYLTFGIFLAISTFVFGLILILCRKRIVLVAQLFKEASKVLADVPMIVCEPILTFIAYGCTFVTFIYFALVIGSSGTLEVKNDERGNFIKASYVQDPIMISAHVVNAIAFLWFINFIYGCQSFVIASTVVQWFFTRTKSKLDAPISRAFSHLLNFHLGSVCLGAMLITLMKIIRTILEGIKVRQTKR